MANVVVVAAPFQGAAATHVSTHCVQTATGLIPSTSVAAGPLDDRQAGQGSQAPPAVAEALPAFDPQAEVDTRLQVIRAVILEGPQMFTSPSEAARAETRAMRAAGWTVQAISRSLTSMSEQSMIIKTFFSEWLPENLSDKWS